MTSREGLWSLPFVQMRNHGHRELKTLALGHTASRAEGLTCETKSAPVLNLIERQGNSEAEI